jgi:hypothetical protein
MVCHLLSRDRRQLAGCCHLAAQPFRRDVEAVRPGRRAEFEEHAGEIGLIPQRFEHRAGLIGHGTKVVHAFAAAVEADAEAKTAEPFESYHLILVSIETCDPFRSLAGAGRRSSGPSVYA